MPYKPKRVVVIRDIVIPQNITNENIDKLREKERGNREDPDLPEDDEKEPSHFADDKKHWERVKNTLQSFGMKIKRWKETLKVPSDVMRAKVEENRGGDDEKEEEEKVEIEEGGKEKEKEKGEVVKGIINMKQNEGRDDEKEAKEKVEEKGKGEALYKRYDEFCRFKSIQAQRLAEMDGIENQLLDDLEFIEVYLSFFLPSLEKHCSLFRRTKALPIKSTMKTRKLFAWKGKNCIRRRLLLASRRRKDLKRFSIL